jgi:hypothetical protein
MSVVTTIDGIAAWAQTEICDKIMLKKPDPEHEDESYNEEYELVHPQAFPIFMPTSDRVSPPIEGPVPGLCVQLVSGKNRRKDGTLKIGMTLATWNPGEHGPDMFIPEGDGSFSRLPEADAADYYVRNAGGWRDAYNFLDVALAALARTESIPNGGRIIKEKGDGVSESDAVIDFGPVTVDNALPILRPYWYTWCSFTVQRELVIRTKTIEEFL